MHGPALTQAMSFLASRGSELPQWVWVLDSDAVISRPDALVKAVNRAEETDAAIVGEYSSPRRLRGRRCLSFPL
jgi:hypothetical protein